MNGKYNHLNYYIMSVDNTFIEKKFDETTIKSHCVLLPMLNMNGLPNQNNNTQGSQVYTIISDDWKQIDEYKTLS